MTRRQKAIGFFVALCILLVAATVSLNITWIMSERRVVALLQHEKVDLAIVRYLNRLADLLFVMARAANRRGGGAEVEWRSS